MFDVVPSIPFSKVPSPPTHSPTLIELFVSSPVIVGGEHFTPLRQKKPERFPPGGPTVPQGWSSAGGEGGLAEP